MCDIGYGIHGGNPTCTQCAVGYYKSTLDIDPCQQCTNSKTTMGLGSTAASACGKYSWTKYKSDF